MTSRRYGAPIPRTWGKWARSTRFRAGLLSASNMTFRSAAPAWKARVFYNTWSASHSPQGFNMEHSTPISLKSLYQAVRRRWRVFLTVTLVVCATGATGVLLLQKKYTATATILLAPGSDQLAAQSPNQGAAMTDPFFVHSETDVASDDSLSREVIQQFNLWTNADFLPLFDLRKTLGLPPKKNDTGLTDSEVLLDNVLKYYQNDLDVSNDGRSNTLTIAFTASDPRMAANIANAHAEAYLQEQSTRRQGLQKKSLEWLRNEVEARADAVREADAEVQKFQLKNGIVSANDTTIIEQRLG